MAKKLFGLSIFLWILIALVVLFFVYGVGRREGFYAGGGCSNYTTNATCRGQTDTGGSPCTWVTATAKDAKSFCKATS